MASAGTLVKPFRGFGGFLAMALDTFVCMFRRPFAWRELLLQTWFVARVSLVPTLFLSIPFTVLTVFTFNVLLVEFGAADFSGTGASLGTVNQTGPIVTVLVVAGAGATAMCADLGARTIRDELDALRVMGINPIQSLVVPRVLAATIVALLLSSLVILVGLAGGFVFSVCSRTMLIDVVAMPAFSRVRASTPPVCVQKGQVGVTRAASTPSSRSRRPTSGPVSCSMRLRSRCAPMNE